MSKQNLLKTIILCLGVLVMSFLVGYLVLAWTEPSQAPPGCTPGQPGCDAPINVGPNYQYKIGPLIINTGGGAAAGKALVVVGERTNPVGCPAACTCPAGYDWYDYNNNGAKDSNECQRTLFTGTNSGNVGIATTTPAYKLDVVGKANATELCIAGSCQSSWPGGGALWTQSGSNIYYNAGNVGIGTTGPQAKLNVNTTWNEFVAGLPMMRISYDGTSKFEIDVGGNVGIGTTGPGDKLEVKGGAVKINRDHQDKLVFSGSHAGSPNTIIWDNSQGVRFWDSVNGELMRITNTGNVNILGTLTVKSGEWGINATGDLYIDANSTGTGTVFLYDNVNIPNGNLTVGGKTNIVNPVVPWTAIDCKVGSDNKWASKDEICNFSFDTNYSAVAVYIMPDVMSDLLWVSLWTGSDATGTQITEPLRLWYSNSYCSNISGTYWRGPNPHLLILPTDVKSAKIEDVGGCNTSGEAAVNILILAYFK